MPAKAGHRAVGGIGTEELDIHRATPWATVAWSTGCCWPVPAVANPAKERATAKPATAAAARGHTNVTVLSDWVSAGSPRGATEFSGWVGKVFMDRVLISAAIYSSAQQPKMKLHLKDYRHTLRG